MSASSANRILEAIRRMPSLWDIFFGGKLAKLFRAIAQWRKQRKLRRAARQAQRRKFLFETLEPRLLLSADTYGFSAAALSGDNVLELRIVDVSGVATAQLWEDGSQVQFQQEGGGAVSNVSLNNAEGAIFNITGNVGSDKLIIDFRYIPDRRPRRKSPSPSISMAARDVPLVSDDSVEIGKTGDTGTLYTPNGLTITSTRRHRLQGRPDDAGRPVDYVRMNPSSSARRH